MSYDEMSDAEEIAAIYGGEQNLSKLVLLTLQEVIDIQRQKLLVALAEDNLPEHYKALYEEALRELEAHEGLTSA